MEKDILQTLQEKSTEVQNDESQVSSLYKEYHEKYELLKLKRNKWLSLKDEIIKNLKEGNLTTGNNLMDYVITKESLSSDNFQEQLKTKVNELESILSELTNTKQFWYENDDIRLKHRNWDRNITIYDFLSLKENPYSINSNEIKLYGSSFLRLSLIPVFSDSYDWPFIEQSDSDKEIVVKTIGARQEKLYDINITGTQTVLSNLENKFEGNSLALYKLRDALGIDISEELNIQSDNYINQVAISAVKLTTFYYSQLKSLDNRIKAIEEKFNFNLLDRVSESFKIKPTITFPTVPFKSDPVLAAIESYTPRTDRDYKLRSLAKCIDDLDRTGLSQYTNPTEISFRPGERTIYNLAEFSHFIRKLIEIYVKEEKLKVSA